MMTKYNEAQVEFREKSKGRIQRQLEISESQTHTQTFFRVGLKIKSVITMLYTRLRPMLNPVLQLAKPLLMKSWRKCWMEETLQYSQQEWVLLYHIYLCVIFCCMNITCL